MVVTDGDSTLPLQAGRSLRGLPSRVLGNRRTSGLPGARNTGIDACETELVAFCDDDDVWRPGKLAAQVEALTRAGGASSRAAGSRWSTGGGGSPGWPARTR
ncbi:hypothetical protein GCM10020001_033550 [Nonomuraea salmonea]